MRSIRPALAAAAAAVLLAACGGGNDSDAPPDPPSANDVPASALASAAAYTTFVGSLALSATGQPLNVTGAVPPTTETGKPQAI